MFPYLHVCFLLSFGSNIHKVGNVLRSFPALLLASVEDFSPMISLLGSLRVKGKKDSFISSFMFALGKSLTKLLLTYPQVLLEGDPKAIHHIVNAFEKLGIHKSEVHKLIRSSPYLLMQSIESFTRDMLEVSKLVASDEDLVLFVSLYPHLIHDASKRFNVIQNQFKTKREILGVVSSFAKSRNDGRRSSEMCSERTQDFIEEAFDDWEDCGLVYGFRINSQRNQRDVENLS